MKGVYFSIAHVPYPPPSAHYPGLALFLNTMKKYEPKYANDEVAIQGWQSAALFAAGVKAAGQQPHAAERDQPDQQDDRRSPPSDSRTR